jgi:putative hydroxymethylpyrimidine transport system substrate-binding protein
MRRVAAPLAAVLLALAVAGCGEDGAEPGAPGGATLILDFQPNAVHSGLYAAQERGHLEDEGLDLEIREPSSSADGAKLLEAGRADFAILDINDYGIARERGLDLRPIAAIVQRPLASVIARNRDEVRTPAELERKRIGVTGVPSDDAVLDTVLASAGLEPGSVERITIGFNAVSALAAGRIDAATAFWNAEGVQLKELGVPAREFRVDQFGAPRYPELVIVAEHASSTDELACDLLRGLSEGYDELATDPESALAALSDEVEGIDEASQRTQLAELMAANAFSPAEGENPSPIIPEGAIASWSKWAGEQGLVRRGVVPDTGSLPCD